MADVPEDIKPINLKEVALRIDGSYDGFCSYYKRSTGRIVNYIPSSYRQNPKDDEEAERIKNHPEDYIQLPHAEELDEPHLRRSFTSRVRNAEQGRKLTDELQGRGSCRRFKGRVRAFRLEDEWYRFREEALLELARDWCEENSLPYVNEDK